MLALIDNYDSFTYNLVQYFDGLGAAVKVYRNDEISPAQLNATKPNAIVISPGPCTPNEAGISMEVAKELAKDYPIFGVCLGMQSMAQAYGGKIVKAHKIMHGKLVRVYHEEDSLFQNIGDPFIATRYNSLAVDPYSLPDCFEVIAWSYVDDEPVKIDTAALYGGEDQPRPAEQNDKREREIMAIRHKELPMTGVQFHPESVLSIQGKRILKNFLNEL